MRIDARPRNRLRWAKSKDVTKRTNQGLEERVAKQFACGDVVPGCKAEFKEESEGELMKKVADHAKTAHGMESVPAEIATKVKAKIKNV
ncbi:MAG: hypothetical protein NVS3B20_25360 [Polyangiales bacterium]